jgi:GPN-loop GTPase
MDSFGLGPNGGIIYCLEYLEQNLDWLQEKLDAVGDKYVIFDFPGQVNTGAQITAYATISESKRE